MKSASRCTTVFAVLLIMATSFTSCVSIARAAMFKIVDVSDKPKLHGDMGLGNVYTMETYLFLQNDQDIGNYPILVTPGELGVVGGMEYSGPHSDTEFRDDRTSWPHVVGVVERGTRLRVAAFYKVNSAFDAGWTFPILTILDGEYEGMEVNAIDLVRKCEAYDSDKVTTHCVDGRLLTPLGDTEQR